MSVLIKLVGIFIIIVLMLQKRIKLGYVMLTAALLSGIIFNVAITNMARVTVYTITDKETVRIIVLITLIMILEKVMSKKQLMSNMVRSLKDAIGDYRLTSLILPAIIGFLPSAGGAIFSAPMIDEVCGDITVESENKSFINFWFRHVWEYAFPIYSGLILASAILKVTVGRLISFFYPYTILNIIVGIPFAYYKFPKGSKGSPHDIVKNLKVFMINSYPITLILLLFFVFKVDIAIALLITLITLLIWKKIGLCEFWNIIREGFSPNIILTVAGIIYFKNMLIETKTMEQIPVIFHSMGIKDEYIALFLPLSIGILTGMNTAFIGITFPIIMNLSPTLDLRLITLAYLSGTAGMMMSPLHLCFTLTVEYFKSSFNKVLVRVAIGQLFIVICGFFAYLIIT